MASACSPTDWASRKRSAGTSVPSDSVVWLCRSINHFLLVLRPMTISYLLNDHAADSPEPSANAGGGKHPYFPRGGGGMQEAGPTLFHRQGLLRNGSLGAKSLCAGEDPFSIFAH